MKYLPEIRRRWGENGMTQKELADRIGCSQTRISFIETGALPPTKKQKEKIFKVFGLTENETIR